MAGHGHKHWGSDYTHRAVLVRVLALCMMAAAIGMAIYSAVYFKIRGEMLLCALPPPSLRIHPALACRKVAIVRFKYSVLSRKSVHVASCVSSMHRRSQRCAGYMTTSSSSVAMC